MIDRYSLAGKVAIVTGGGVSPTDVPSIGEATCRVLAARGAKVAVLDIDLAAAEAAVARLEAEGAEAMAVRADVSDEAQCRAAVESVVARWGGLHILVNNVAILGGAIVTQTELDDFERQLSVNLNGAVLMAKHAIPAMTRGGSIVNVSSIAVVLPTWSLSYSVAKGGMEALTAHITVQYGPDGIRCNTVRPGEVWTSMVARHSPTPEIADKIRSDRARRAALPRPGDAWDVANAIAFFAGDESGWISGQTLTVDGGGAFIGPNPDWQNHPSYWKASISRGKL